MRNRVLFALGLGVAGTALPAADLSAPAVLRETLSPVEAPYRGRMIITRSRGHSGRLEEVNVYYAPPDRYRWEYLTPEGGIERTVVSDGAHEVIAQGDRHWSGEASRAYEKKISDEDEWTRLLRNYQIRRLPDDRRLGRAVRVIELQPLAPGKPRQRMTIDRDTRVVLENRRFGPGPHGVVSQFVHFETGVRLPDDLFAPAASPGTRHDMDPDFLSLEELARETGRAAPYPRSLGAGFDFESADVFSVGADPVRHLRYTDGLTVLSLFETPRPIQAPATDVPFTGGLGVPSFDRLVHWRSGDRYYMLMGDVSESLLNDLSRAFR